MNDTITAMVIPADTAAAWTVTQIPNDWEAMAAAIRGRYIECIPSQNAENMGVQLIGDEEGRLSGRPANPWASALFSDLIGHPIVGDVLLVGDGNGGEEFDSIPAEAITALEQNRTLAG